MVKFSNTRKLRT